MKYPYYVEYMQTGSPIMRLPDELGWVTVFLSDVMEPPGTTYFLKDIERVLQGEASYAEASTEICDLQIRPDFTTIINSIEDPDDEDPQDDRCVIETKELRDLLLVRLGLRRKERMKYRSHIEFTPFGLPIMRLPQEIQLVSRFLFCEMEDLLSSNSHLEEIDRVLLKNEPVVHGKGKAYHLQIRRDFTTVIDLVAEIKRSSQDDWGFIWRVSDSNPRGVEFAPTAKNSCDIETPELKKLMVNWRELKEHLAEQQQTRANNTPEQTTDLKRTIPKLPVENLHFAPPAMTVERKQEAGGILV
jgi:hypothetical protein